MIETLQMIEANWMVFGAALVAVVLIGWMLLRRGSSGAPKREYKPDVLDQGAASVHRNQALIDAPPAAQVLTPPPFSGGLGGVGEAIAIGAQDVLEEAEAKVAAPPPPPPPPPTPEVSPPLPEPTPQPDPEVFPAAPETDPSPLPEVMPEPDSQVSVTKPEPVQLPVEEPQISQPEPGPIPHQTPEPDSEPAQPANLAHADGGADDLSRIKGLGPKLQALLPTLGLSTYAQIAALGEADLAALDSKLGPFAGRPAKDNWVEQARFLASGDVAGFEARFGKV